MHRMKTFLLVLLGIVLSPIGNAQPVKVTVVPVESISDFKAWLGEPMLPARAGSVSSYPGRLDRLPLGRETLLPIVVTGLPVPVPQEMHLVADVEILGADGRSFAASPRCCDVTVHRGSLVGAVLLDRWAIVQPEGSGGSYTVRVSLTDGQQTWTTNETLPYGDADVPGFAHEAPRLRMTMPPPEKQLGSDKRGCLALGTPAEVIKCTEKK
jgi:hypothetical protein